MKSFASDNYSSVSPEVLEFLTRVNVDHQRSYGNDDYTKQAVAVVKKEFNAPDAKVHFMLTGTAANVLSIKHCTRSTESIVVPQTSHLNANEGAAPEVMANRKLIPIPVVNGKINLEKAEKIVLQELDNIPHAPKPKMLSIAQATEYGTVYTVEELKNIREFCDKHNLIFHIDFCRVYNAAISLGISLADMVSASKPDIASLGGTKNGLMFAEAVVIFNPDLASGFDALQKQGMQLYSKMRYLSAQFIPFFESGLWKTNAEKANSMCNYLHEKIKTISQVEVTTPVETNHIFVKLPKEAIKPLQEISPFYVWNVETSEVRFVTSFDTTKEEIDIFANKLVELLSSQNQS